MVTAPASHPSGGTRVAVITHRVTADEQILNSGEVEQFQELS
jgi:hypothetical protein